MTSKKAGADKRVALPRPFSYSRTFLKDYERYRRSGRADLARLKTFVLLLSANEEPLDAQWQDHALDKGAFAGTGIRDAHIHGDFLVLYRRLDHTGEIVFERLGTHSQLFG